MGTSDVTDEGSDWWLQLVASENSFDNNQAPQPARLEPHRSIQASRRLVDRWWHGLQRILKSGMSRLTNLQDQLLQSLQLTHRAQNEQNTNGQTSTTQVATRPLTSKSRRPTAAHGGVVANEVKFEQRRQTSKYLTSI